MYYVFHDLVNIILDYINELTTYSNKRSQHRPLCHILAVTAIQHPLESPKVCLVCYVWVPLGIHCLQASKQGITIDPFKFQASISLPPPWTLRQLQSLQDKDNFFCWFVANYATHVHGFLRLLHQDIKFQWDDQAQPSTPFNRVIEIQKGSVSE